MATARTDTDVSWEVAFDFDYEPNSLSALLSGGNFLWTMHDENRNLDNSCTKFSARPSLAKTVVISGAVSSMAAVLPGQPGHQRSSDSL